jgi:hypothetical protein
MLPRQSVAPNGTELKAVGHPEPALDPTKFRLNHPSDDPAYQEIDQLNREHAIKPLPFPAPHGFRSHG